MMGMKTAFNKDAARLNSRGGIHDILPIHFSGAPMKQLDVEVPPASASEAGEYRQSFLCSLAERCVAFYARLKRFVHGRRNDRSASY
jgi:hypothetical protein